MEDIWDSTQLALDFDAETHKWALYTSSRSPDYNANTAYSSTNEISGTGYTAGGKVVTGTAFSRPGAGVSKYSTDAVQWTSSTLSGVQHIDMYADALAGDNLMVGIALAVPVNTSDGTLLVTPHSSGLFTVDWTP
ncbi:hypothetical protein [Streptosporangium jomthongense]